MMIFFVLIILLLLSIGHAVVYKFFLSIFPVLSQHLLLTRVVFLILTSSFILVSILTRYYDNWLSETLYTISAIWLGFLFYLFLATFLYSIILLVSYFVSLNISLLLFGRIIFAIAVLVGVYGIYNANNIIVTNLTVKLPNLPEAWNGRKAVFVSDIHLGQVNGEGFAKRITEKVKELNPDIIFNGGDLYDGVKVNADKVLDPISISKPRLGQYFVTGNHEEYGDQVAYNNAITKVGIRALNNEVVNIEGVNIVGVDYATTTKTEDFDKILKKLSLDPKIPSILIKHVPFDLNVAEEAGINLQLSGHTHRGQMWPSKYITKMVYKGYDYGLKNFNKMQVLVTDGVGTWGPPMRVGTNAEIVLITFE